LTAAPGRAGVRRTALALAAATALSAALALVGACTEPPPATGDAAADPEAPVASSDAPPATAKPAPPAPDDARREVRAHVVRLSVRTAESFPPQHFADVTSALEDGCAQFSRTELRRTGDTLFVDVFHTRPIGERIACTMIYGEKETAVALGSDFVPGRTYTVDANGVRQTFVAQ
jgi:hypothetical protein